MKPKFRKLVYLGLGGLFQLGLLVSCTNDSQESNNLNAVNDDVPVSTNLTGAVCSAVMTTWKGTGADYNGGVDSEIDDRSCSYDYAQGKYGSSYNWGAYRLQSTDDVGKNQTRIERGGPTVKNIKDGNLVRVVGYCRILRTGATAGADKTTKTSVSDKNGSYFIQVKGNHTNTTGDPYPAIALFLAKPVRDTNGNIVLDKITKQPSFDIYREEIKERGGTGTTGRQLVFITNVKYNTDFKVDLKTGFKIIGSSLKQYIDSNINGVSSSFTVPQSTTNKPTTAYIRMGAYRCHSGEASILWREGTAQTEFVDKK